MQVQISINENQTEKLDIITSEQLVEKGNATNLVRDL